MTLYQVMSDWSDADDGWQIDEGTYSTIELAQDRVRFIEAKVAEWKAIQPPPFYEKYEHGFLDFEYDLTKEQQEELQTWEDARKRADQFTFVEIRTVELDGTLYDAEVGIQRCAIIRLARV